MVRFGDVVAVCGLVLPPEEGSDHPALPPPGSHGEDDVDELPRAGTVDLCTYILLLLTADAAVERPDLERRNSGEAKNQVSQVWGPELLLCNLYVHRLDPTRLAVEQNPKNSTALERVYKKYDLPQLTIVHGV